MKDHKNWTNNWIYIRTNNKDSWLFTVLNDYWNCNKMVKLSNGFLEVDQSKHQIQFKW